MRLLTALTCVLVALIPPAPCRGQAPEPSEGYIKTADGVRLFYRIVAKQLQAEAFKK